MQDKTDHLIICEDSRQDFELMSIALQDLKFPGKITWLRDGEEAVKFFTESTDCGEKKCLILDINMPKKNGFEVLEFMRRANPCCKLPIIMLSTSQSPNDRERALELGVDRFMVKPFEFSELKNSVITILDFLESI